MTSDKRITVCFPFAGDSLGGSHISTLGLLRKLDPTQFRIIIITEILDGKIARFFDEFERIQDPAPPKQSFAPGKPFGPLKFARTFTGVLPRRSLLRKLGADIVHTNDGRTHAAWGLATRLAGIHLVWHHRADPNALGLRLLAPLLASRVLTVSSFSLPRRKFFSAANKAEVVHSPFDTKLEVDREEAQRALRDKINASDNVLILGYFGSFVPRKRPLLFVDTMSALREILDRPVIGLMFGEAKHPEMDDALRDHIEALNATEIVKIMGFMKPGAYWIAGCDQLVVPAVGEPFGRTLIEAMLVGTPVVAAESGGNIEALAGGLGLLVPPDDATALATVIASVSEDIALVTEMIHRARTNARERYCEERHTAQVTQVYFDLLDSSQGNRRTVGAQTRAI